MRRAFTITETAGVFAVHPRTILREIRRGRLQACRVGKVWRVPADELERYTQAGCITEQA